MTDDEIKKLAKEIVKQKGGFYVEPESHYQQHARLDKLLSMYDSVNNMFVRSILWMVILGALGLAVFSVKMGWSK